MLFGRHQHLGDRPPGRVAVWAEAFDRLVAGLRDCTRTGQITSDDPYAGAITIWAALHGYATLRASLPRFDWPAPRPPSTATPRPPPRQAGKNYTTLHLIISDQHGPIDNQAGSARPPMPAIVTRLLGLEPPTSAGLIRSAPQITSFCMP